jgi:pSer/pThr/pTyr-binding forkhead associated (FHA) protein
MAASRGTEVFTRLGGELAVSDGPDRGRNLVISKPTTTIGRSGQRKNDLDLSDTTVSREQAKVLYNTVDRSFKIINESTTNPTRVNGSTVDTAVLQDGDRIEFGNTVVKFKKT